MSRKIEREVVEAACIITRVRLTNLVVQVKTAILQSEYPGAVVYMRTVDALRQLYNRYLKFVGSNFFGCSLYTVFFLGVFLSRFSPTTVSCFKNRLWLSGNLFRFVDSGQRLLVLGSGSTGCTCLMQIRIRTIS
jgi:hypothetical protein